MLKECISKVELPEGTIIKIQNKLQIDLKEEEERRLDSCFIERIKI